MCLFWRKLDGSFTTCLAGCNLLVQHNILAKHQVNLEYFCCGVIVRHYALFSNPVLRCHYPAVLARRHQSHAWAPACFRCHKQSQLEPFYCKAPYCHLVWREGLQSTFLPPACVGLPTPADFQPVTAPSGTLNRFPLHHNCCFFFHTKEDYFSRHSMAPQPGPSSGPSSGPSPACDVPDPSEIMDLVSSDGEDMAPLTSREPVLASQKTLLRSHFAVSIALGNDSGSDDCETSICPSQPSHVVMPSKSPSAACADMSNQPPSLVRRNLSNLNATGRESAILSDDDDDDELLATRHSSIKRRAATARTPAQRVATVEAKYADARRPSHLHRSRESIPASPGFAPPSLASPHGLALASHSPTSPAIDAGLLIERSAVDEREDDYALAGADVAVSELVPDMNECRRGNLNFNDPLFTTVSFRLISTLSATFPLSASPLSAPTHTNYPSCLRYFCQYISRPHIVGQTPPPCHIMNFRPFCRRTTSQLMLRRKWIPPWS